jgi:spore coat polysaccharide biosynthesis predicted glycosyltransferase SpsG
MLYYYANTGHKIGLERLRRGVALLNSLSAKGVETQFLVNDFRAGLVAKDLGVRDYVTVEGVQDIDAIAEVGNSIIIDSVEDDHGRLVKYCADFKDVWRFAHDANDSSVHGETILGLETVLVDDSYFEVHDKEERVLFFLGDADYDKTILGNEDFFKAFDMELLLGNYFFVKYEDDLAKLFSTLHEPEEYENLIKSSSTVVTASGQTALEAKVAGAKVIYLALPQRELYEKALLESYGIIVIDGFDIENLTESLQNNLSKDGKNIEKIDDKKTLLKQ